MTIWIFLGFLSIIHRVQRTNPSPFAAPASPSPDTLLPQGFEWWPVGFRPIRNVVSAGHDGGAYDQTSYKMNQKTSYKL